MSDESRTSLLFYQTTAVNLSVGCTDVANPHPQPSQLVVAHLGPCRGHPSPSHVRDHGPCLGPYRESAHGGWARIDLLEAYFALGVAVCHRRHHDRHLHQESSGLCRHCCALALHSVIFGGLDSYYARVYGRVYGLVRPECV